MARDNSSPRVSEARWTSWPGHARRALDLGLDLVFPPVCAGCRSPLEDSRAPNLCLPCRESFADIQPYCQRCGAAAAGPTTAAGCPHCAGANYFFRGTVRLGTYQAALRSAVLRTKRRDERGLAAALGQLLSDVAGKRLESWRPDVVVPVPMHWMRRMWRGANCPETIAERLAARLGAPLRPELLSRRRRTRPQANLSPNQRQANVRGAFRAASHRDLPGACVLLVDDIMTTGATLNEAAKTLARAGAAEVFVAVIARAQDAS